jgi:hypothetical protein
MGADRRVGVRALIEELACGGAAISGRAGTGRSIEPFACDGAAPGAG